MATAAAIQTRVASNPTYQAYQILHVGFAVLPIVAGLDKFFHILVNWDMYLGPFIARLSPISGHNLMMIIGVIEIIAGILVAIKPRIGAYVVAAWLCGIIINLLLLSGYYDVALRDFEPISWGIGARTVECGFRISKVARRSQHHSATQSEMCALLHGNVFLRCLRCRLGPSAVNPQLGESEYAVASEQPPMKRKDLRGDK